MNSKDFLLAAVPSLASRTATWLVTGAAGFIGSHLVEALLNARQRVIGVDNFATGHRSNLEDVLGRVPIAGVRNFSFHQVDICDAQALAKIIKGVDYVLHQAALGSVPRSIADPLATNRANVDGFLQTLTAAQRNGVKRFVYASSSAVYGDHPALPKREESIGAALSPYAVSKRANELYADVFARCYNMQCVGLRYFNVFGPRQDPQGAYAAVIPRWIAAMLQGEPCTVYGDGETSRDFCFVDNVVLANILAAVAREEMQAEVINVALGGQTSLKSLHQLLANAVEEISERAGGKRQKVLPLEHSDFRAGDIRHSLADLSKAQALIGYAPLVTVAEGILRTVQWFYRLSDCPKKIAPLVAEVGT